MSQEMLAIAVDRRRDPGGSRLQAVLEAQFAYERARTARRCWLGVLILSLALTWVDISGLLDGLGASPIWLRAALAAMTAVVLLRTALACSREWRLQHRWAVALDQHPGAPARD